MGQGKFDGVELSMPFSSIRPGLCIHRLYWGAYDISCCSTSSSPMGYSGESLGGQATYGH